MATDNPFAILSRNLAASRLSAAAVDRNLTQEKFRSASIDRSAPPAQVAAAGPHAPPKSPDTAPSISAFAGLAALRPGGGRISPRPPPAQPATGQGAQPTPAPPPPAAVPAPSAPTQLAPTKPKGMLGRATAGSIGPDLADVVLADEPDSEIQQVGFPSRGRSLNAARGALPEKPIVYTGEQSAVIECDDKIIVVDAFAGCAKTTTAIGYAAHRPKRRMLYLCLNTANAEEAQRRFGPNVTAATTHSVAWQAMKPSRNRVTKQWRAMLIMDQLRLTNSRTAMTTMKVLNSFFCSADTEVSEKHAQDVQGEHDLDGVEVMNAVAYAALAWKRMLDPGDQLQMPHDAYLKMFALKAPKLDQYDTIIFDEAQDANPVTSQIIRGQKHVNLLCIGDRHQSIYAFRGSVNAMEQFSVGATRFHLSQTFRFGPRIAETANTLLSEMKGERVPIRGMGQDHDWNPKKVTTLARTNAELFRLAAPRRGEGVHWVGGKENKKTGEWIDGCESYRLEGVIDAYHLYARERGQIQNELMRRKFANWDEYVKYAEDAGDGEAKIVVKVVEEFQHDVPDLVADIKKNAVRESRDADLTLTTLHRAKGLEWPFVQISNDFEVLEETEAKLASYSNAVVPEQAINLLYVGLSRAQHALKLNGDTEAWLKKLPEHRKNRQAAASRLQADLERQSAQLRAQAHAGTASS